MSEFTGLEVLALKQMNRVIREGQFNTPTTVGRMRGMDTYWNRGAPTVKTGSDGIDCGEMAFNWWTGAPKWVGVNGLDPVISRRRVNITKNTKVTQGRTRASQYQMGEPIDKTEIRAYTNRGEAAFANWIQKISQRAVMGAAQQWQADLFPTVNLVGGSGVKDGVVDCLMNFAYPLQTGYAGNNPTGTGVYSYLGIDLNTRAELKALNVGTDSVPWVFTVDNLRRDIIDKLRDRDAQVDMVILPSAFYHYARAQLGNTIRQMPEAALKIPGDVFQDESGVFWMREPRLDLLPKPEIYVGDSSVLSWGFSQEEQASLDLIDPWPEVPTSVLLQGWLMTAFINENPRFWGRAYNCQLPS